MGCRHSSSPPASPMKIRPNGDSVELKSKLSIQRSGHIDYRMTNGHKSKSLISVKKTRRSISQSSSTALPLLPLTISGLEQTFDGRGKNLLKRFELDSACLLLDVSNTHTLLLDDRQLRLIHLETMQMKTLNLSIDCLNIQEIAWSTQLNAFLLLTTDQLYRTSIDDFRLVLIHQIQFISEGPRKSYMAIDGDDLLINRSFGSDIRRYSLSTLSPVHSPLIYSAHEHICVTTIRLNSKKILALAVSISERQMIDLVELNSEQILRRISLPDHENILYPIDLHHNGQWFAKTCIPCTNIGHCLISPDGQINRLTLFPNQDNFIRSFRLSADHRWLLIGRQHALEIYQLYTSLLPLVKDLVGFSSASLK